jgi:hypothetical protein
MLKSSYIYKDLGVIGNPIIDIADGLTFGAGINRGRLGCEVRYAFNRNILKFYNYFDSKYNFLTLILKYNFMK